MYKQPRFVFAHLCCLKRFPCVFFPSLDRTGMYVNCLSCLDWVQFCLMFWVYNTELSKSVKVTRGRISDNAHHVPKSVNVARGHVGDNSYQ